MDDESDEEEADPGADGNLQEGAVGGGEGTPEAQGGEDAEASE